ncbi:unnamed protein product [Acanthosepion pharaonis]|uniref:Uncharacterized protein n=1 Tax=Acanthosepion pharaonis TaxID=158019 RepID=A0A812DA09_ACAPH|nr:unnamed protein product [Sepia pharaonis]
MKAGSGLRAGAARRPDRGGADQEPGAVPCRLAARRHRRQRRHDRRRAVADRRGASRRTVDRGNRISFGGRGDDRPFQGAGAGRVPDHRRHEHGPAADRQNWDMLLLAVVGVVAVKAVVTLFAVARRACPARRGGGDRVDDGPVRDDADRAGHRRPCAAHPAFDRQLLADGDRDRPDHHAAARQGRARHFAPDRKRAQRRWPLPRQS